MSHSISASLSVLRSKAYRRACSISLLLAFSFLGTPLSANDANDVPDAPDALAGQVRALHEALMRKDIASRYTRSDIGVYFAGRNDLDNFIVSLFSKMDTADFSEHRMDDFSVDSINVDPDTGAAEVALRIEGPWFIFFDTDFQMTEKWIEGPNGWRLALPNLVNLPVR